MRKLPVAQGRDVWKHVIRLMSRYRRQLWIVVFLQIAGSISLVVLPWLTGEVVERVSRQVDVHQIVGIMALGLVLVLVGAVLAYFADMKARVLGESVFAQLREEVVNTVTHLPLSTVEDAGTGDLLGRTTRDIEKVQYVVRQGISAVMSLATTIVITVVAAFLNSPLLALTMVVPLPLIYITLKQYLVRTVPAYRAGATAWADMAGVIAETVDQAETIDTASLQQRRDRKLMNAVGEVWRLERYSAMQRLFLWSGLVIIVFIPVGLVLALGAWLYPLGVVTAGQITAVALYCYQVRGPVWNMAFWIDEIQSSQAALGRIFGVNLVEADRDPSGRIPTNDRYTIQNVSYEYRVGKPVLHSVSLDLRQGETIALVGPSGAGKSTLGRMLAGIHPPTAGCVKIGGVDLVDLTEEELHRQVVLVSQEHHVFGGTIADNLRLADSNASDRQLRSALESVDALPWLDLLEEGINTEVGAGALELSPGQAQQLALARIVLMNPNTLVLDEATSLMDPTAARSLESSLAKVLSGRTVVAIAHRLHTAHDADRVAVMVDGRLAELGSHNELVRQGGEYAALWGSWQSE